MKMDFHILSAERGVVLSSKSIIINNLMEAVGLAYNLPDVSNRFNFIENEI